MKHKISGFDGPYAGDVTPLNAMSEICFHEAPIAFNWGLCELAKTSLPLLKNPYSNERFILGSDKAWYLPNGGTHGFRPFMTNNPELAQYYKSQGCLVIPYKVKK